MSAEQLDLLDDLASTDLASVEWRPVGLDSANALLERHHYLGPISGGRVILGGMLGHRLVAVQVWRHPTSRRLPTDGSWLELSRWCLTPGAGDYAGSRQHAAAVRHLRVAHPEATTLVSYSDPSAGHTGSLYRACNWLWAPTWLRLRPPPTAQGKWAAHRPAEAVKDRWVFPLRKDPRRGDVLAVNDPGAIRKFLTEAGPAAFALAARSPAPDLAAAVRQRREAA